MLRPIPDFSFLSKINYGHTHFFIQISSDHDELLTIDLPFKIRRRARGEKLIVSSRNDATGQPDRQLIRAVALGHSWFEEIKSGNGITLTKLAARHKIERTDAGRILRLAFLAPDIVEAILDGRQPRDLSYRRLKRLTHLPNSWEEQRKVLKFAA